MIRVSPSTLVVSDEKKMLEYALLVQNSGADYLHLDVMDGRFVKNKALSFETAKKLSFGCLLPMDVHLMVNNPIEYISEYLKIKPNYLTTHFEAYKNEQEFIHAYNLVTSKGVLFGLSIKPSTKIEDVVPYLKYVHLVMPMSVEPGAYGQTFIDDTLSKIEFLDKYRKENNLNYKIECDGGVNHLNIDKLKKLNVDIVVVGSALYNAPNKKLYIDKLKADNKNK